MAFTLRYSPHLGYAPPDLLLFRTLAGQNRANHVRFAAREGLAGVLYPWAADSPVEERQEVQLALRETGLECSCIVSTPLSAVLDPVWVTEGAAAQAKILQFVKAALHVAEEIGSKTLAVLVRSDGQSSPQVQRQRAAGQLRMAADVTSKRGVTLALEPMIALPDMLLPTFAESVEFIRTIAHPGVRLIFDSGHVTDMGDPLLASYVEAYDDIHLLQIADMPGRVEPGRGQLDITGILTHAIRRGYRGLVDLEHDWWKSGEDSERQALEALRKIDAEASRRAASAI